VTDRPDTAALLPPLEAVDALPVEQLPGLVADLAAMQMRAAARLTGGVVATGPRPQPTRSRATWLRVAQVATDYGVSSATVYDWIYKRRVTTKKLGTAKRAPVLLYRPDVERLTTTRRPLRSSIDRAVADLLLCDRGAHQGGAETPGREPG
jgi:hypothetical protein